MIRARAQATCPWGDPISDGLVSSLNRPGGNVTGINFLGGVLGAKRLDLLRQIAPKAITIGVLVNPNLGPPVMSLRRMRAQGPHHPRSGRGLSAPAVLGGSLQLPASPRLGRRAEHL